MVATTTIVMLCMIGIMTAFGASIACRCDCANRAWDFLDECFGVETLAEVAEEVVME